MCHSRDGWSSELTIDRPVPQLVGKDNEELQKRSWDSIIAALTKDVPEVKQLTA